jgi:putative RNA 2'-phosphotransferase
MSDRLTVQSKFVSFVLRHSAEKLGLDIDSQGWVSVEGLIRLCHKSKYIDIDRAVLEKIVESDMKHRYDFNEDGTKIRANQGHSMECVKIEFDRLVPPQVLFHGTSCNVLPAIHEKGISKMKRHHVHLSETLETAQTVGRRHGKLAVIVIDASQMWADGVEFLRSENNVWLVDHVDPKYFKDIFI